MLVKVTKEHMKNGSPKNCDYCPIALALRDAYPGSEVNVDDYTIDIDASTFITPGNLASFIYAYDQHNDCATFEHEPFEFKVSDLECYDYSNAYDEDDEGEDD